MLLSSPINPPWQETAMSTHSTGNGGGDFKKFILFDSVLTSSKHHTLFLAEKQEHSIFDGVGGRKIYPEKIAIKAKN